jgi:hypothetical protein
VVLITSPPRLGILNEAISIEFRAKKVPDTGSIFDVMVCLNQWENMKWGVMDQVHAGPRPRR